MLTGRTGARAVPRADIWETSRDFPALDGSRQDPGGAGERCGPGGAGESRRLPVLPRLDLPRSPGAGGGCSARGQCPLPRIEKVTGNVSAPRAAGTGFSGAFPTEPYGSFDGGPQAQDAGVGDARWANNLCFHVFHVLASLLLRVPK